MSDCTADHNCPASMEHRPECEWWHDPNGGVPVVEPEAMRERAEFWTTRDPSTIGHLYDKDAVAFAAEVLALLDELRFALKRAEVAEAAVRSAHTYCARPAGVCLPVEPLPRRDDSDA